MAIVPIDELPAATAQDAAFVYQQWHFRARAEDVDGLLELYRPDAVLESPLIPRLTGQTSGVLTGHKQIRAFLEHGTRRRPHQLIRWQRTGHYLFNGRTLFWEYPRDTAIGDQLDIAEVMDLTGPLIHHHRIYWGWFGIPLLAGPSETAADV